MSRQLGTEGSPCPQCQLKHQCVCDCVPSIDTPFHLALLMHENECQRETNTGRWLERSLSNTSVHVWQRKQPCEQLVALLANDHYQAFLLFPGEDSIEIKEALQHTDSKTPLFIVLDATWQEAQKMLRKSPWLEGLPLVHIQPTSSSRYRLRRNQEQGHMCTLEVGSEILTQFGQEQDAKQLLHFLDHYMQAYQADKSGHALKS